VEEVEGGTPTMNAKDYLQSVRDLRFKIADLKKERKEVLTNMIVVKSTSDYSDRVQTTPRQDGLEMQVIRATEQMEKIDRLLRKKIVLYQIRHNKARAEIRQLPEGQCRRFLLDYYIEGKTWEEIFQEYGFKEISSPYHLQERAVKLYERFYRLEH
jgi:hypothetical protein